MPGIATVQLLGGEESARAEVLEVSARLMQLRNLLGGRDDIDIVRMLVREPGFAPKPSANTVAAIAVPWSSAFRILGYHIRYS